jgi:hypothetical protein
VNIWPQLASNLVPLTSTSWIARLTGVSHCTWLVCLLIYMWSYTKEDWL